MGRDVSINTCYTSLVPFEYNILQVQPGSFSDPLRCTLSTLDLRELPPYEALSYTWGENVGHKIDCDGRSVFIRENLCSALRRLRQQRTARLLWVDAVCNRISWNAINRYV